jgi:hypothetical protein
MSAQNEWVYFEWSDYEYRVSTLSNGFYKYLLVEAKNGDTWVKTGSLRVLAEARKAIAQPDVCLCGAPSLNGVCSVAGCVCGVQS